MNVAARAYVYEEAKKKFGMQGQVIAAAEEFSEAAAALCRNANGKTRGDAHIIEELADAEIMCEQMRHYFNGALIDAEKDRKLRRFAKTLGIEREIEQCSKQ